MATIISENTNAPYYGYRGCKKVYPRAVQYWDSSDSAIMTLPEHLMSFSEFTFNALGQTFIVRASSQGKFWIYCNSCTGYSKIDDNSNTYYLPYSLFLNTQIDGDTHKASSSELYSEINVVYYKVTSEYIKYIVKGSRTWGSSGQKAYYIEYIIKSDGVIQIKSTRTLTGVYLTFSKDKDNEYMKILEESTLEAGISYVIKITGSLTDPVATLYTKACIDYEEELPIVGLLSISNPEIYRFDDDTTHSVRPIFRNLVYPTGNFTGENVMRIKTQNGVGEMLLKSPPSSDVPHLGIRFNGSNYGVTDYEGDIEEYVVRNTDWYSYDELGLTYTNFYVNEYSTTRYWNEVPIEYILTPVTGVTQLDILFTNYGGTSCLPNSDQKLMYLCYTSAHGNGELSANSNYWKNVLYTLKSAYRNGCTELITFTFSSPVTIAEFCLLPRPVEGYSRRCLIESWCIHTNTNVITNYAQNGAVRYIN